MNGRKLRHEENILQENILDEPYDLHHIKFEIMRAVPRNILQTCHKNSVISLPRYIHRLCKLSYKIAPHDVCSFYHQFMTLQIIAQLYDGFDELLDYLIAYDDFKSFAEHKKWERFHKEGWIPPFPSDEEVKQDFEKVKW